MNFTGGMVTDRTLLNSVPNTNIAEDNCELDSRGYRRRRLGMRVEVQGDVSADGTATEDTDWVEAYNWNDAGNLNLNFIVVQIGDIVNFYNAAAELDTAGRIGFIDLSDYRAPGVSDADVAKSGLTVAGIKGRLLMVGERIEPILVQYTGTVAPEPYIDTSVSPFSVTEITIRIRDLEQMLHNPDSYGFTTTEANFSLELYYDLYNQGWGSLIAGNDSSNTEDDHPRTGVTALGFYLEKRGVYPPKSKSWWVGKRSPIDPGEGGYEIFDPSGVYESVEAGNTLAPLGHFILNAFNKDRNAAIAAQQAANPLTGGGFYLTTDFDTEVTLERPTAVGSYAGHAFYGLGNKIYFSQLIDDDFNIIGDCYQEADPTSEQVSDLIATDGGVIELPTTGKPHKMVTLGGALLVFFSSGVYAITGSSAGEGFSATGFSAKKISNFGSLSARTIVEMENSVSWWAKNGIYVVTGDNNSVGAYQVTNISENKIDEYYQDILIPAKEQASGAYDSIKKRLVWCFQIGTSVNGENINSTTDRFLYTTVLNYDIHFGAFFPWTTADSEGFNFAPLHISGVFNRSPVGIASSTELVVDSLGVQVTDSGGDTYIERISYGHVAQTSFSLYPHSDSDVGYLIRAYGDELDLDTVTTICFGDFISPTFRDWRGYTSFSARGHYYTSYMLTWYQPVEDHQFFFQVPYIYIFMANPEIGDPEYSAGLERLVFQGGWDWADTDDLTIGWSTGEQVYINRDNNKMSVARKKVRGRGRVLQLRFSNSTENDANAESDFHLYGWGTVIGKNTEP